MLGKTCVVTGGAGGIGQCVVDQLLQGGYQVAVVDARKPMVERKNVFSIQADLTDQRQTAVAFATPLDLLGKIDAAVNAAGIFGAMSAIENLSTEQLERVTFGNIRMCLHAMQAELRIMKEAGQGRIINVASVAGSLGIVMKGDYCGAKHAIVGFTKTAALENIKNMISVNTVSPGFVDTEMTAEAIRENPFLAGFIAKQTPLKRSLGPDVVAKLICWLVADAPAEITGSDYVIDGGYSAR